MKAFLMYRDRDIDLEEKLPANAQTLTQDLELDTLFRALARGDQFLFTIARQAILSSMDDPDAIRYRQDVLRDCLKNGDVVRQVFQIPIESNRRKKKNWMGIFSTLPQGILGSGLEMLDMFVELLKQLRSICDEHAGKFESEGFRRFFAMIAQELDDEYFAVVDNHLKELRFRNGVLLSAELGRGNEGTNYALREPSGKQQNWLKRVLTKAPSYTFTLHPRDDHGARALGELRDRGINLVANAVGQAADHIDSFFNMLWIDLAFYVGCLNLYETLNELGEPVSFPVPVDAGDRRHSFTELYDVSLALTVKRKVVGNDVNADHKDLAIITGANEGGKSTFLRSIGLSQLMMQCGMFVPAESFRANVCDALFTHFKREEDATMESGKLDEELGRMSEIVDHLRPNSLVLFNESFAATNEREGSEIARQITSALLEKRIKVFFVTHLYELARGFYHKRMTNAIYLRAERQADGTRTFRLTEGEPLQTSYGQDLYHKIFQNERLSSA